MKTETVSIAEGKKDFSRLIQASIKNKEEIIVTKRGKPVAVIVSYEEFQSAKRTDAYAKIMEARDAFLKTGMSAKSVYKESRKLLEKRH